VEPPDGPLNQQQEQADPADLISKGWRARESTSSSRRTSGTGKEGLGAARFPPTRASPRAGRQFLKVNCAALEGELLTSSYAVMRRRPSRGLSPEAGASSEGDHHGGTHHARRAREMTMAAGRQAAEPVAPQDGELIAGRRAGERSRHRRAAHRRTNRGPRKPGMRRHQFRGRETSTYRISNVIEIASRACV